MDKTLRFFCLTEGGLKRWFADVPGHTLAENEMVAGCDEFLEQVDTYLGGRGEVNLTFNTNGDTENDYLVRLKMKAHNQWGATYTLDGPMAQMRNAVGENVWICNVTHDVLGEHPRTINILNVA